MVSRFRFVCSADYTRTIHETTPRRTTKAASCDFVDRFQLQGALTLPKQGVNEKVEREWISCTTRCN